MVEDDNGEQIIISIDDKVTFIIIGDTKFLTYEIEFLVHWSKARVLRRGQ